MAITILIITAAVLIWGYSGFARRVDRSVIQPDPRQPTPARRYADGMDFAPAKSSLLFGFQFKSITLDPIIGPIIAIQFGWLPVLLWLVFGAIFAGWVQPYAATIMGLRSAGASLGQLTGQLVSGRASRLFLAFVYIYLLLVMGAFGSIVTPLLARGSVPLGFLALILAGALAGQMIYRWQMPVWLATSVCVTLALLGIYAGATPLAQNVVAALNSLAGDPETGFLFSRPLGYGALTWPTFLWTIVILAFCYLGAVLPLWHFIQPVNYVAFWFVLLIAGASLLGIAIATLTGSVQTSFDIPPVVAFNQPALGPIWPVLFVTVSCGAVSGWHALVSNFSTARQLEKESDALPVSAGASLAESILPVLGLIFAAALGVAAGRYDPNQNFLLVAGPAGVYAHGVTQFLSATGIPPEWGNGISTIFLTMIVLTVLPLVLRYMRLTGREFLGEKIPAFKDIYWGTLIAALLSLFLILFGFWQWTWVLFGGANQLMAAIVLLLASIWLARQAKMHTWTYWPAIFLSITSVAALAYVSLYRALYQGLLAGGEKPMGALIGHSITAFFGVYMLLVALVVFLDGKRALDHARGQASGASAAAGS